MAGPEPHAPDASPEPFPDGIPVVRTVAMPADTNPSGDIFGGWLMCQMDLAAGTAAARHARGSCATVAVEHISFRAPVKVGDEVAVWAELIGVGRTSMRFKVSAWRRTHDSDAATKVTEAVFVFVALDAAGRPRPLAAAPSQPQPSQPKIDR
jgi:acyl-CoA thioesterase YciA